MDQPSTWCIWFILYWHYLDEVVIIIISTLQIWKLRPRRVKQCAQGLIVRAVTWVQSYVSTYPLWDFASFELSWFSVYYWHSYTQKNFFFFFSKLCIWVAGPCYDKISFSGVFLFWWHLLIYFCSSFSLTPHVKFTKTPVPTWSSLSGHGTQRSKCFLLLCNTNQS